ncbi:Glycosyltransferase involved in cell wall bisynthesis [Haloarcula vallismortis]|uniref:Glycosyltransferase (Group 1) n=2 Tax=Haloarcula vallismortis TaxID=28442 RepID=M0JC96_HALVA|nr:glycosyltransferase family 4 protein [Haloarcula vallismortis]EMA06586.1 glycosyltransferase (group 1) [Haloarcula vallismortis ATCC 29715]SDW60487.1 Glycosyltransferase involved in cell wall bisynthesis [Haloarcula vallismortis]
MVDRVIAICPSTSQGLQDYSQNLYAELSQRVVAFRMLCNQDYTYIDKNPQATPIYGKNAITDVWLTVAQLRQFKPDIIHSQSTNLGLLCTLLLCKLVFDFELVLTPHSSKSHFGRPLYERFQVQIYNRCDGVIWHTEQDKERMEAAGVTTPQAVIDHGSYDFYTDYRPELTQSTARRELGLNEDDYVFLFFGYLRRDKRLDLLLNAFAHLDDSQLANATLLIAGKSIDDDLTARYIETAEEYGITDHVETHIGFVENDEVPVYFKSANTLVTPYDTISESGVVHIGFAFGLPVIATEVEGFAETFEHGTNGLLVPPDDRSELTGALNYSMTHHAEMQEMGAQNRERAQAEGWQEIAQETVEFYESL